MRYGMLTVIGEPFRVKGFLHVSVQCTCGTKGTKFLSNLKRGITTSCGCFKKKRLLEANVTHGLSKHPLRIVHKGMIQRCCNSSNGAFKNYGGRGIKLCKAWRLSFKTFYDWAVQNGWRKGFEIDRVNNNKGYYPKNCRFVSKLLNARNKRNNRFISFKGCKLTLSNWAELTGIPRMAIAKRINSGWPTKKALNQPVQNRLK